MAAMLWVAFLMAPGLPALATECLMIGKVYEDISKQKQGNVQKWEDCAHLCNQTDSCSRFTYQPQSAFTSTCWLMQDSANPVIIDDPYSISGSKSCLATRPASLRPCPEPGVFFGDNIYPDPHLWTSTWQDCQAKCESHTSCKYFTWKEDTTPNGGCWMLPSHNVTKSHSDRYAISGLDECPWIQLSDSDKLEAKTGDPGEVGLDCRANHTLYTDLELPAPKMYLQKWEDCQSACDESDSCNAYSYKQDSSPPGGCWLFRTLKYGTKVPDDKAITGRKWCKIPEPELGAAPEKGHPSPGPNLLTMLCFGLTFLCCFGLLLLACLAFKKSAKKRAVDIESSEEEVPVLTSAPPVAPRELHFARPMRPIRPSPPMAPMAMEPVTIQRAPPVTAVTAVTYRIEPKRVPVQLEPSEPVASGV